MTRRGSLIYYLAAWALGCFFMVLMVWCRAMVGTPPHNLLRDGAEEFLSLIFYGYIRGAATALLYGFILRRIMSSLKCKTPTHWAGAGAIIAPLVVVALGIASRSAVRGLPADYAAVFIPLVGAENILSVGWWLAIPAGAATGYYLGRIQRAFAPPTPERTASLSV